MSSLPVFAHRGASAYALENTLKAFDKALALGADGIELDIQFSKDGLPVVYHDPQLSRLVGTNKLVSDCTLEELLGFKLGKPWRRLFSSYKMPSFEAVLAWAILHQMPLNIELKSTGLDQTSALVRMLDGLILPEGSHFSSFHYELLEIVKKQRPEYETALIATKKIKWDLLADYRAADTVHMHKRYYKPRYLEACVLNDKAGRFYAIDGTEQFLTNPHPAVIGWITDYPDKVLAAQQRA
ncbi:glycerophosphodiester phosphodiesterase [Lysinibacillus macroides]|uniref:Glycerophosphodiester phosphodiesterase n=1 Tax=Lysinibacillus macroides TaxID=33935 RepID=A0A0M9DLC0_9BACI|nr:glycerophosphodiester phosphodiesterase [Lysinibacillus macroides]KOY83219.1 glycerophosphodiester phosphodiesterase [Lysinibacillus macroides]